MKFSKLSVAILSVLSLSSCGGGGGNSNGETSNDNHEPIASFSIRINYLEVIATDTSTDEDGDDDIVKYSWVCSDGSVSNEKNFRHVFVEEGTYTISHYVTDRDGKQSLVVSEDVVVERKNNAPVASFDFTTNNLEVVATNTSYDVDGDGDIVSYLWKSSDGGLSHNKDFSHVFQKAGTYTISLTVTDSKGAVSNQYSKVVTVKQNYEDWPVASFSIVINGNTVTATYDGTDDVSEFSWSSSDGGLSKSKKFVHTFSSHGKYSISLIVKDKSGRISDKVTKSVVIPENVIVNHKPKAAFTISKHFLRVTATNTSTDQDGPADIVSYAWTSSDGGSATTKDYVHTFAAPGTYTISLVVTDSKGASSAVATQTVTVEAANNVPVASFTVASNYLDVTATNTSTDEDGPADIVSYAWTSSDGGSATTKDYVHTFAAPGTYTISLVVTDSKGASSAVVSQSITVESEPIIPSASFTCGSKTMDLIQIDDDNSYYAERIICSIDGDLEPSLTYSWNVVGDGATCNSPTGDSSVYVCTFSKNTETEIELIVSDSNGTSDESSISYTPSDVFRANFYDSNQSVDEQFSPIDGFISNPTLNAEFVSNSVIKAGGDYTFTWDFGDGMKKTIDTNTNIPNTLHSYLSPTVYEPVLTIRDNVSGIETKVSKRYYYFLKKNCSNMVFKNNYSYDMYYMYYLNDNNTLSYVLVNNAKETCISDNDNQCPSSLVSYYDDDLSNDTSEISYGGHFYTVNKGRYGILKNYSQSDTYGYNGNHQLRITATNNYGNSETCVIDINIANRIDKLTYEGVVVGDLVQFGTITTLNNEDEIVKTERPIIWEVVKKDDVNKRVMLLQTYDKELSIDIERYYSADDAKVWKNSGIRTILNNKFSNSSSIPNISMPERNSDSNHVLIKFNELEKQRIVKTSNNSPTWYRSNTERYQTYCTNFSTCLWQHWNITPYGNSLIFRECRDEGTSYDYLYFLSASEVTLNSDFSTIVSRHWINDAEYLLRDLVSQNDCSHSSTSWESCASNFEKSNITPYKYANIGRADNQIFNRYSSSNIRFSFNDPSGHHNTFFRLATWIELSE